MILSTKAMAEIESHIENVDIDFEGSKDFEGEVEDGDYLIMFTFWVNAHFHEEYNYHNEVPYNNIEDLSHYEFDEAEITDIKAYDEDGEEVEITNKHELEYW